LTLTELGNANWKLAMSTAVDQVPLVRTMPAYDLITRETQIARDKAPLWIAARERTSAELP
jgi:hypothetical protein